MGNSSDVPSLEIPICCTNSFVAINALPNLKNRKKERKWEDHILSLIQVVTGGLEGNRRRVSCFGCSLRAKGKKTGEKGAPWFRPNHKRVGTKSLTCLATIVALDDADLHPTAADREEHAIL